MSYPKGKGKSPGSGRKKGTPNKKTEDLQTIADELGINPFKILLYFAAGDWKSLGYPSETDIKYTLQGEPYSVRVIQPDTRVKAASEAAQYLYAKRKQIEILPEPEPEPVGTQKTFTQFCTDAGYPEPYPQQIAMMEFGINDNVIRLLLGSRGYGKTDYVTMLGTAYKIYLDPTDTTLILTKSKTRNTAMLNEIANALVKNGVELEKSNATEVRVKGLIGKDSSVSAATIKSVSMRGRHPNRIIMDDPVTPEDVAEAARRAAKTAYNEAVKLTDNVLLIGQPVHKFDLFEEVRPIIKKMEMPFGSIPELDPDLEAQRLAGVDEASIQASYYLKVAAEGTTPFDKIQYMDSFPTGGTSVAFIDPSDGGNDTALSIFKHHMQGMAVVGFTWKKSWHHCLDDMAPLFKQYRVERICFETNKHGPQALDALRQVFTNIGVVGRHSSGNKHSRIMAAGAYSHMIFLSKQSSRNYIDQVVKYEDGSKVDDAPDSLATGLEWIGMIRGK